MKKSWILTFLLFAFTYKAFGQTVNLGNLQYEKKNSVSRIQLISDFENSFNAKLMENREAFANNASPGFTETNTDDNDILYFDPYNAEKRSISDTKKDMIIRSAANAAGDSLKKTPIGIEVEILSTKIASYFRIIYRKQKGEEPKFIIPGEVDSDKREPDYEISFSTSLYEDLNSIKGDFSGGLGMKWNGLEAGLFYRPLNNEVRVNLNFTKIFSLWAGFEKDIKSGFMFVIPF